ncbi:uncharacterized protein LOC134274367 [Saccostrea cucullata]|uniref:uncharacterized protein LOC134274367 n=1 Tax=Saccostrea cuccullata TaxID=36930 RepID=UPI002ED10CBB
MEILQLTIGYLFGQLYVLFADGCSVGDIAGRCDDTEFCFCKNGEWRKTNLSIAKTIEPTLTSFSKLCTCTEFVAMDPSHSTFSGDACKSSSQGTTTASTEPAATTNTEKYTISTMNQPSDTTDQNCCCSADFQAKVEFWKNETNQLLHRLNLENSIKEIQTELSLEKKNLSSIVRSRTCAPDQRESAVVAGYIGAIVIIFVISVIIIMDLPVLFLDIQNFFKNLRIVILAFKP